MLFREFAKPSYEEWKARAEKLLNGAAFEQKLVTGTYEGISLQPLYQEEDMKDLPHIANIPGQAPYVRGTRENGYAMQPWEVCQELAYETPEAFNQAARYDVKRGQTMLNLALDTASVSGMDADQAEPWQVGHGGVSLSTLEDVEQAFKGIDLGKIPLLVQAGSVGLAAVALVAAHMEKQGQDLAQLRGCIGADPLGELVKIGTLPVSMDTAYDSLAQTTRWAKTNAPQLQTILVNENVYHDGGASAAEELAFAIATGVEYLRELDARDVDIDDAAVRMRFSFSIGSHFFMEIAKLRAARMLWANVVEAFGGSEEARQMTIHTRTSARTKTVHDPYVNMLRSTTEAFAGIIGGTDSLHVSPFDEAIRPADEFSRRIARNTQLILQNEAHLTKVADPAGGSWYIESLTDELAEKAWALFQQIEACGGMFRALQDELPQTKVAEVAAKRQANINRRKDKMVGTNSYPNLQETTVPALTAEQIAAMQDERRSAVAKHRAAVDQAKLPKKLDVVRQAMAHVSTCREVCAKPDGSNNSALVVEAAITAVLAGATLGDLIRGPFATEDERPDIQPIQIQRDAASFEELRANAERYKQKNGAYPGVFLAKLGAVLQYKARADFAAGFVEAGGFQTLESPGFTTVEEAAQAVMAADACLTVICSHDELYPEMVPVLAKRIKEANPQITVWLAGRPTPEQAAIYKQAGVDDFIYMGANCADMLAHLSRQKGIGL